MTQNGKNTISHRKKEHIELCLTDKVAFREKTNGFNKYDFLHYAATEVKLENIELKTDFFEKQVAFPFMISCMTGGTSEAENINAMLALAAKDLNIPLGVGSQRQLLENKEQINSYKIIRKNARNVPVLGNIGAAQIANGLKNEQIKYLIDIIEADAFVIHLNPLQELVQKQGEPDFSGLMKAIERIVKAFNTPIIVKEVGSGISKKVAKNLLEAGVRGIDVAGAGGTSWSGVELLRNADEKNNVFWDWGLPTSYCIRKVNELKKRYDFLLIGSGGINNGMDAAKAIALGAEFTASARMVLQELERNGIEGVINLITQWFEIVKKVMYLTGSATLRDFRKNKLIKLKEMY